MNWVITSKLDCRGVYDPLPIVLMRRTLDKMKEGEILEMVSDDPASESDMHAWAKSTGHKLLEIYCRENEYSFYVQKNLKEKCHG